MQQRRIEDMTLSRLLTVCAGRKRVHREIEPREPAFMKPTSRGWPKRQSSVEQLAALTVDDQSRMVQARSLTSRGWPKRGRSPVEGSRARSSTSRAAPHQLATLTVDDQSRVAQARSSTSRARAASHQQATLTVDDIACMVAHQSRSSVLL